MLKILFFSDKKIGLLFFFSLGLNIISWAIALWAVFPFFGKGEFMALHKTIYFGIDWLGPWYEMFFLPFLGLFFLISNFLISHYLTTRKKEEKINHLINWSTLFLEAFLVLAVYSIARLNL